MSINRSAAAPADCIDPRDHQISCRSIKKTAEQASISGTGYDTLSTEDLAQLPQAGTATQQAGVEILPVEASPVTQSIVTAQGELQQAATTAYQTVSENLNHEQKIQAALKAAGFYTGNVDGKIGPASKKAIAAFQTSKGLKADGKVGPKTWAALEAYLSGAVSGTPISSTESTTAQ